MKEDELSGLAARMEKRKNTQGSLKEGNSLEDLVIKGRIGRTFHLFTGHEGP